jgi:Niemann-Pick C1 protein
MSNIILHFVFQLGEEEGKGLNRICYAPLVAAGDAVSVENCAVQSVWGYLKNSPNLTEDYIDTMMRCIQ